MTLPSETLAPDWRVPEVLPRGLAWRIGLHLRNAGVDVTPTSASVSLYRDTGATQLYAASGALTPAATTEYALTVPSTESLSMDWVAVWTAVVSGQTYTYRQRVCLVGTPLSPRVDQTDLYEVEPDLRQPARLPAGQTSWTPQITSAWYDLIDRLTRSGKRPWLAVDLSDLFQMHLYLSLARVCAAIPSPADGHYANAAKRHAAEATRRETTLGIEYEDAPGVVKAVGPSIIRCAPPRPTW